MTDTKKGPGRRPGHRRATISQAVPLAASDIIIPENGQGVKSKVNRAEIVALVDRCLERHNAARAKFILTGDADAFREALAMAEDRETLLSQLEGATDG